MGSVRPTQGCYNCGVVEQRDLDTPHKSREYKLPKGMFQAFQGMLSRRLGDTNTKRFVRVTPNWHGALDVHLRIKIGAGIRDEYTLDVSDNDTLRLVRSVQISHGWEIPIENPSVDFILGEILTAKKLEEKRAYERKSKAK